MATTVFSKVGFSVWFAIASTSLISSPIPCSSAGWKCSSLILSNGGRLNGSLLSMRSGLAGGGGPPGVFLGFFLGGGGGGVSGPAGGGEGGTPKDGRAQPERR